MDDQGRGGRDDRDPTIWRVNLVRVVEELHLRGAGARRAGSCMQLECKCADQPALLPCQFHGGHWGSKGGHNLQGRGDGRRSAALGWMKLHHRKIQKSEAWASRHSRATQRKLPRWSPGSSPHGEIPGRAGFDHAGAGEDTHARPRTESR